MALISYKSAGESLTAYAWNSIFTAADALVTAYLNGLSPLLAQTGDNGSPRKFFFFNPVVPPAGLHPLAYPWLATA